MATVNVSALQAEIAELKAKLEARNKVTFRVSEKGCLSMYGLGRFPVSLYASQWERLISHVPEIQKALAENADKLSRKEQA